MDEKQGFELVPVPSEMVSDEQLATTAGIRRFWDKEDQCWYYSIVDCMHLLANSPRPDAYWVALKKRHKDDADFQEVLKKVKALPLRAKDGRLRETECATRETLLRIIMEVPSPLAEQVRLWLAQVGEEKLQDVEQQTQVEKLRDYYIGRGRTPEWAEARIRNLIGRNLLTDEWLLRGAQQHLHFGLLTGTIHKGTFDITTYEHHHVIKKLPKGIKHPQDHYTEDELGVLTLAELAARRIHEQNNSQGIDQLIKDAQAAGEFGGQVRRQFEELTKQKVVSPQNFLDQPKGRRKKKQDQLPPDQPTLFNGETDSEPEV
jgi:DNA-damage-inducible protein D